MEVNRSNIPVMAFDAVIGAGGAGMRAALQLAEAQSSGYIRISNSFAYSISPVSPHHWVMLKKTLAVVYV